MNTFLQIGYIRWVLKIHFSILIKKTVEPVNNFPKSLQK